jgi:WD40 domain-containing protein
MMPKRVVDLMTCEVMRGVRLTAKTVEYVAFKVPRKSGTFQADLYPPCRINTPAMTFEQYNKGEDKEPNRVELRPESRQQIINPQRRATFL